MEIDCCWENIQEQLDKKVESRKKHFLYQGTYMATRMESFGKKIVIKHYGSITIKINGYGMVTDETAHINLSKLHRHWEVMLGILVKEGVTV